MDPILVILLVTVGLGTIRWILLSLLLKHSAPLFTFLLANMLASIITLNVAGLAGDWLIVCYLVMAVWFVCVPVETHTERKTTV